MINKKQYFLNANIIDPCNSINGYELIIDEQGKIKLQEKELIKITYLLKKNLLI